MDLNNLRIPSRNIKDPALALSSQQEGSVSLEEYMASSLPSSVASQTESTHHGPTGQGGPITREKDKENGDFAPPRPAQPQAGEDASVPRTQYPATLNIMSMDDFIQANPYSPATEKQKLVPVPGKGTTQSIPVFNELCQKRGFLPHFTETEVHPGGYEAKVEFAGQVVEARKVFMSKKAAREAVCKIAIQQLADVGHDDEAALKRKTSPLPAPEVDASENWVGIINEYTQGNRLPLPDYVEYLSSTSMQPQFACTVRLVHGPLQPFGSGGKLYASKQAAKSAAAKEAVLFLRSDGKLPPTSTKRVKTSDSKDLPAGQTGLTQSLSKFSVSGGSASLPQRLHEMVTALGFQQPRWDLQRSTLTSSGEAVPASVALYDVAAYFTEGDINRELRLEGPLGQVRGVHGKEKAKAASCALVLPLLEEIREERRSGKKAGG